jgi:hypothetical protein
MNSNLGRYTAYFEKCVDFPQSLNTKAGMFFQMRSRLCRFTPGTSYCLLFILLFNVALCEPIKFSLHYIVIELIHTIVLKNICFGAVSIKRRDTKLKIKLKSQ